MIGLSVDLHLPQSSTLGLIADNSRYAPDAFIQTQIYIRTSLCRSRRYRTGNSLHGTHAHDCSTKQYPRRQAQPPCTYLDGTYLPPYFLLHKRRPTISHLPRSPAEKPSPFRLFRIAWTQVRSKA